MDESEPVIPGVALIVSTGRNAGVTQGEISPASHPIPRPGYNV